MLGLAWLQRKLLFPAHLVGVPKGEPSLPGLERWWLSTDEGRVEVWFLPGDGVSAERPGPTVLFAHGNGELVDFWPATLQNYRRLGVNLVLPEYRGYGRSAGKPSEAAIHADLCALYERMASDPRIEMRQLVYHGRSLGGGAVCGLARQHPPCALILESTFTSVADVAGGLGIPRFLIFDRFESLPVVQAFSGPVLVLHGTRDTVVPVGHARRLAASNPRAQLVLYDVGHNDLPPQNSDYWQHIERTLQAAFGARGPEVSGASHRRIGIRTSS